MGSKSPLSYQEYFYINTRHEGVEYNYMMYKGESKPKIDLLTKSDTTERNGTEIKIIIKNEEDLFKFLDETYKQLHYFQNVVIDLDDLISLYNYSQYGSTAKNISRILEVLQKEYRLLEGTNFIARTNTNFNELHLCIGNVAYPIDWNNLKNVTRVNLPLALKFNIGELPVIQTREDIRYTDKAIQLIEAKIELLFEELTEIKKKETLENFESIEDLFLKSGRLDNDTLTFEADGFNLTFRVNNYIDKSKIPAIQIKNFPVVFTSNKHISNFHNTLTDRYYKSNLYSHIVPKDDFIRNNINVVKTFNSIGSVLSTNQFSFGNYTKYTPTTSTHLNEFFKIIQVFKQRIKVKEVLIFKIGDNWSLNTKKNRYIQEVLYKDINLENMYFVHVRNNFKIPIGIYKMLYKHFNGVFDKTQSKTVIQYLFKLLYKDFQSLFIDYNSIKVDEAWWKKRQAENRTEVDYDRSLMSIETFIAQDWERKEYRPGLEDYINKHDIRILINKEQQKQFCNNNRDWSNTKLQRFIRDISQLFDAGYVKNRVVLHSTAQRNYDKIIKHRNEDSNIFTLGEFFNDEKMQTRILSKLITVLKIKQVLNSHPAFNLGVDFFKLSHFIKVMNDDLVADYNDVSNCILQNRNVFQLDGSKLEELLKEIDEINLHVDLYDKDLLAKFDNLMEFIVDSKFNLLNFDIADLTRFVTTYKPSKVKFRLNTIFNKLDIDDDFLYKKAQELKLFQDTIPEEEKLLRITQYKNTYNFGYTSQIEARILFILLCRKQDFTQKYIPLTPQELSLDLTPDSVEEPVVEVVEQEEIDVEEEIEFV